MRNPLIGFLRRTSLVVQILIGMIAGALLAWLWPQAASAVGLLGTLFVSALKAVAPVLVFVLVMAAIGGHRKGQPSHIRPVMMLYLIGTFAAAAAAVLASFLFPTRLTLDLAGVEASAPGGIVEVLHSLLLNTFVNPVQAIAEANFIGVLVWGIGLGLALRHAGETTRTVLHDFAYAVAQVVRWVVALAPLGVFGLVASSLAEFGPGILVEYGRLLALLLGTMAFVALVINPAIVAWQIRRNPYPLVFTCLRESGITAFFTRSSAANIPVNLQLCERLGLPEHTYSVAIPLGAALNMAGAAVTVSVMSLAAANTLGIAVDLPTALLLCVVASLAAAGTSGVAGGSLLLIPLATSLFGISADVALQVVAIGFVISVLQDSTETALNSSTDALFTAAACMGAARREEIKGG